MTITQRLLAHVADCLKEEVSAIERVETMLQDSRLKTDMWDRLTKNTEEEWNNWNDTDNSRGKSITQSTNELWP